MAAPTNAAYVKKALANSEPSTHGCTDQCCLREESSCQLGAVHTWHFSAVRGTASSRQLLEVERTCRRHRRTDAIDPLRKSGGQACCDAQQLLQLCARLEI